MGDIVNFPTQIDLATVDSEITEAVRHAGYTDEDVVLSSLRRRVQLANLQDMFDALPD